MPKQECRAVFIRLVLVVAASWSAPASSAPDPAQAARSNFLEYERVTGMRAALLEQDAALNAALAAPSPGRERVPRRRAQVRVGAPRPRQVDEEAAKSCSFAARSGSRAPGSNPPRRISSRYGRTSARSPIAGNGSGRTAQGLPLRQPRAPRRARVGARPARPRGGAAAGRPGRDPHARIRAGDVAGRRAPGARDTGAGRQQGELGDALQVARSEPEAYGCWPATCTGSSARQVTMLNRNNRADRLEPVTPVRPDSPSRPASRARRPTPASRSGSLAPHRSAPGEPAAELRRMRQDRRVHDLYPSLVGGEVIGALLVEHAQRARAARGADRELGRRGGAGDGKPAQPRDRRAARGDRRADRAAQPRAVHDMLKRMVAQAGRTPEPLAVVLFDLDHFKRSTTPTATAGDDVLAAVGASRPAHVRASDFVGRFGGEEFAVILPGTDREGAALRSPRTCARRSTRSRSPASTARSRRASAWRYCRRTRPTPSPAPRRRPRALPGQGQRPRPRRDRGGLEIRRPRSARRAVRVRCAPGRGPTRSRPRSSPGARRRRRSRRRSRGRAVRRAARGSRGSPSPPAGDHPPRAHGSAFQSCECVASRRARGA